MSVDASGGEDQAFTCNDLRRSPDFHARADSIHDARISRFTDSGNPAITNRDVGFIDPGVIQNEGVRNDQIRGASAPRGLRGLSHAVANDFAASEFAFVAI